MTEHTHISPVQSYHDWKQQWGPSTESMLLEEILEAARLVVGIGCSSSEHSRALQLLAARLTDLEREQQK